MTRPAKPGQTIACSCCPAYEHDEDELGEDGVPLAASCGAVKGSSMTTNIVNSTEQALTDGSITTEKTTAYPDGSKSLETTSTKPMILKSSVSGEEKKEEAGGGDEGFNNDETANEE
jgi:hypothetical protein